MTYTKALPTMSKSTNKTGKQHPNWPSKQEGHKSGPRRDSNPQKPKR